MSTQKGSEPSDRLRLFISAALALAFVIFIFIQLRWMTCGLVEQWQLDWAIARMC